MEVIEELSRDAGIAVAALPACPQCGEPWGALEPIVTSLFQRAPLRRCERCGARFTAGEAPHRRVRTCDGCDMPFLEAAAGGGETVRCTDCLSGRVPAEMTDGSVAEATETEIQDALRQRGAWVGSPQLAQYLSRLLTRIGKPMCEGPQCVAVGIVDDRAVWTMALPSGTMLLSRGLLAFLQDEAELIFILAHEWTHVAQSDASERLARRGLLALARDDSPGGDGRAGADLLRLGYGRTRERKADLRAVEVMLELGYDPDSVMRLLERIDGRMREGDPDVAEYAIAHPPPAERRRYIEESLRGRIESDGRTRVNREVFRRVAGPAALASELRPLEGIAARGSGPAMRRLALVGPVGWWVLFGLLVLLGLILVR